MTREILNLDITVGPLHYHMQAYDEWASGLLSRMNDRVVCRDFNGSSHRSVHIVKHPIGPASSEAFLSGDLPSELAALVDEELPTHDWQITGNDTTHLTWKHSDTNHAFWTESCGRSLPPLPFQFPLDLILHDIVGLGGAILHGGLAIYDNQGVLLTAPPDGGKTTAFSTTPASWQLEADDAALVWPGTSGKFMISPLPTWSVLLGINRQLDRIVQWQVDVSSPLAGVFFLDKAATISLTQQPPLEAVFSLYRALSEYPTVIMARDPYRVSLFRAAAALARAVPAWSLQLPRKGNFWPHIEEVLTHVPC